MVSSVISPPFGFSRKFLLQLVVMPAVTMPAISIKEIYLLFIDYSFSFQQLKPNIDPCIIGAGKRVTHSAQVFRIAPDLILTPGIQVEPVGIYTHRTNAYLVQDPT